MVNVNHLKTQKIIQYNILKILYKVRMNINLWQAGILLVYHNDNIHNNYRKI